MIKRFALVSALLALVLSLCACSVSEHKPEDDGKLKVMTTIFPQYDFVREIGGDKVSVEMLLSPGAESHSFEPTAQDIIRISECDLFICVGGESESWISGIIDSLGEAAPETLTIISCINLETEEIKEGMQSREEADEDEVEYDEHVWASPKNAMDICSCIAGKLSELDPANAASYQEANDHYLERLSALDELFSGIVETAAKKTIVVGDRFPFRYFTECYDLDYFAAFPGCSSESEPSAATVTFLVEKVKSDALPIVFYTESSNHLVADAIAEAAGCETLLLHSCHTVTKQQLREGVSYISLMEQNAENLSIALN